MFPLTSATVPSQTLLITDAGDWNGPWDQFPIDLDVADFDGYIVVYDHARLDTFKDVKEKADKLVSFRKPVLLVSTRYQDKEPEVSRQEGYALAHKYGWTLLEDIRAKNEGEKEREQRAQDCSDPFTRITYQLQARTTPAMRRAL